MSYLIVLRYDDTSENKNENLMWFVKNLIKKKNLA